MVLLEAMSYGVPCIAYRTDSGTGDIIANDYNGFIIENRDLDEYINKIDLVLSDIDLRKKLGKNAVDKAKEFYKDNVIKKWIEIFKGEVR